MGTGPPSSRMEFLRSTHFYRKTPRDFTTATAAGGGISIIGAMVMAIMFISELGEYMSISTVSELELDNNSDEKLLISFNISLHELPCEVASLDISDVMGTRLQNVTRNVFKYKLDAKGRNKGLVDGDVDHAAADNVALM